MVGNLPSVWFFINPRVAIDMSNIAYQIPFVGMPYEFYKTGSIRQSAPGTIAHFLALSAGKHAIHAWLGFFNTLTTTLDSRYGLVLFPIANCVYD